ncbi:MAG: amidohydrolase family protein [Acidimicrobiia bacterium]
MHDLVIRGGSVVDGTGASRRTADVAIDGARITEIGRDVGAGHRAIDADGLIVAPGFIDVHTHLDVQGFWDPALTPSPLHGVTTVIAGNCGFSVAPLDGDAARYLLPMLARVEGMPVTSLERGVPWDWTSTADYLDRLDGTLALNAGFMVGHSALRRVVMANEATEREATHDEVEQMRELLRAGIRAGALGFSSSWSIVHNDATGGPVPSRCATADELVALAAVCGELPGTSLEFVAGQLWDDARRQVMVDMTVAARRPLNWNLLAPSARGRDAAYDQLALSDVARARGGKIVALVIPFVSEFRVCFLSGFVLDSFNGWGEAMTLPPAEKLALLSDPEARARLGDLAASDDRRGALADWGSKLVLETFTPDTKQYEGRRVADIAAEVGTTPFDALVDIVVADGLRTSFTYGASSDDPADWEVRRDLWLDPRTVVGGSDAGAHLDSLSTFSFATDLLSVGVRERGLISTEEAVRLLTSEPAALYGLVDRGTLREGAAADLVIFDEDTVGHDAVRSRFDLPGGAGRLYSEGVGIEAVLVGGAALVDERELTDARTGVILRSGRDTSTPEMA